MKKILLGHLNSMGDCLYASVIARQIKEVDYPGCHLTWAVNGRCRQVISLNPDVDEIWEIPTKESVTSDEEWNSFVADAEKRKKNGEFDFLFLTQILGENWLNYDGGIRSSTYNNYPHKITVSHEPVIQLSDDEIENVKKFTEHHRLNDYEQVILVECAPDCFNTALDIQAAQELALEITSKNKNVAFILSSNKEIDSVHPSIIDGSKLSFRENAELTKYCHLFLGNGSGISWLATSTWAKKLKMILVVNQEIGVLPSMIFDHEYLKLPTDHLIEIKSDAQAIEKLKACLVAISTESFASAKKTFNEKVELKNFTFLEHQISYTRAKLDLGKSLACLKRYTKRNGWQIFLTKYFWKFIWNFPVILRRKLLLKFSGSKKETALINQHK